MDPQKLLKNAKTIAVIGASRDEAKYGFKVTKKMHDDGYTVIPVNPNAKEIYNIPAVSTVNDIEDIQSVDIFSIITPPGVSLTVSKTLIEKEVPIVWFQPGSYNQSVIDLFEDTSTYPIVGPCILIEEDKLLLSDHA